MTPGRLLLCAILLSAAGCAIVVRTDWERPWRLVLLRRFLRTTFMAIWSETIPEIQYGTYPSNRLEILKPRWPRSGTLPAVIVFHGGGWEFGSREEMRERVCRRYLERGFVVVNADYRPGLRAASEDAETVVAWSLKNIPAYGGDVGRVVLTGESAGAHLALLTAFQSHLRVAAVVNFYGVCDLSRMPNTPAMQRATQGDLTTILRLSPLHYVRPSGPPVISIHGTEDELVPLEQTEILTRQVRSAGVVAEQVLIEHGRHGLSERQLNTAYRAVFEFLHGRGIIR